MKFFTLPLAGALALTAGRALADNDHTDDRDTQRLGVSVGAGAFGAYPGSIEAVGPWLGVDAPLWLGHRYRFFQWRAGLNGVARVSPERGKAQLVAGPQAGFDLYFGSFYGFELLMGLGAGGQVGKRWAPALGLNGGGSHVFRFFKDDRKRIKLSVSMYGGAYLASDPGNDLGTSAMALGLGVGYETAL